MDIKTAAKIINAEFIGENFEVTGMNTLKKASKTEMTFISNKKYIKDIPNTNAGAIIITEAAIDAVPAGCAALIEIGRASCRERV